MASEVNPPPYVITDTDKRGLIVVIAATTLSFVWTCLLIRTWLRVKTGEWRSDDYFLAAATVLNTIQSGLVFHLANSGLGTPRESLSQAHLERIGKNLLGAELLSILTLLLSKCAVLFLYLRLSPGQGHVTASWTTIALSCLWTILALALTSTPCNPSGFWAGHCSSIWPKSRALSALDIATEASIFLISIYLVYRLNMRRSSKLLVVAAFSARLPVILAAALRLHFLAAALAAADRPLAAAYYVVATQWQVGYAIMSSTITGLGPFLRPFSKSFSASYRRSAYAHDPSLPSHAASRDREPGAVPAYQLAALPSRREKSASRSRSPRQSGGASEGLRLHLRPDTDGFQRDTAVSGGPPSARSVDDEDAGSRVSDESGRMIITKRTELKVETGRRSQVNRGGR